MLRAGRTGETLRRVERDIRAEKAAALGRAGERLEVLLGEVQAAARALGAAREPAARERLGREYEAARARALAARQALVIQREAIGLRHHQVVDQQFPEPPPLDAGGPTHGGRPGYPGRGGGATDG